MTTEQFLQDEDLVRSWRDALAKEEIVKLVMETMDESSPIYGGVPEIDKESEAFRLGFIRGYSFFYNKLKELGKLKQAQETTLRRNWGETAKAQ